jgi:hypothetical protein
MTTITSRTIAAALRQITSTDATRPLLTWYDDATGERLDLSGATLGNWVAKTANLLVDGHGLVPGDIAVVDLPPHWQSAAVLLGCWSAGLIVALPDGGTKVDRAAVTDGGAPTAGGEETSGAVTGNGVLSTGRALRGAVGFSTGAGQFEVDDHYALALLPLGAPFRPGPPPGTLDYVVEVRGHGDVFASPRDEPDLVALVGGELAAAGRDPGVTPGTGGMTHREIVERARARALPSTRVLIDAARHPDPFDWLVTPLVAQSSVVLCANLEPARLANRLAAEHATTWP